MKKRLPLWMMSIAASLILSTGLLAQEKTAVTVKIEKDGKVVTDTTYLFDDMDEARHALEMMDLISGEEKHMDENVKVIVITKSGDEDCDHDKDHDHDADCDHDENVEVKVVKKKVKKEKE